MITPLTTRNPENASLVKDTLQSTHFGIPYESSGVYIEDTELPFDYILKNIKYSISFSLFHPIKDSNFLQNDMQTASLFDQVELRLGITVHLDAAAQHVTCGSDDPVEVDLSPGISGLDQGVQPPLQWYKIYKLCISKRIFCWGIQEKHLCCIKSKLSSLIYRDHKTMQR